MIHILDYQSNPSHFLYGNKNSYDSHGSWFLNKGKEFLSTVLDSSYNYSSLLSHSVKKGEECQKGYKKCGILDSMNNIMCLKEDQTCPINLLFVTDMASLPTKYSNYTFKRVFFEDGKILHFTNQAVDQYIVTGFRLSDSQVCINSDEYNSPYSSYVLDYYQYYGCKTKFSNIQYNTNYNKLDTIVQYNLYDKNHILTKLMQLPEYNIENLNQQKTNLYMKNYQKNSLTPSFSIIWIWHFIVPKKDVKHPLHLYF